MYDGSREERRRGMVAGWVMSARRVVMPGRGDIGWRSIATILTSFRGLSCGFDMHTSFESEEGDDAVVVVVCGRVGGKIFIIACRCFSALSSHADRPNFSPLISTLESTCDHEPGAAHRSTTRVTSLNRSNSVSKY